MNKKWRIYPRGVAFWIAFSIIGLIIALLITAILGIGCLILLIKKLFHYLYIKIFPVVDNASDLANGKVVSEKRAYKNLKIMIIVIFSLSIILQLFVVLL